MRAAVILEQGKPQRFEELILEAPRRGEVLVRMAASGVCHSCLHAADGSWQGVPRRRAVGDGGGGGGGAVRVAPPAPPRRAPAVGGLVVLPGPPAGGRCPYCLIGRPNLCEPRQP